MTPNRPVILSVLFAAASARAGGFGADVLARTEAALEAASSPRAPVKKPPTPIAVKWKAKHIGAVDLGAPLLAMTAGDLDGDGRAEIVAVTEGEVEILAPQGRRALAVVARIALPAVAAEVAPRQPVASARIVHGAKGAELDVRASTAGRGARYTFAGGKLREVGDLGADVYPLCPGRDGALAPGRDDFERASGDGLPSTWPNRYWAAACRDDLVDHEGRALAIDAVAGVHGEASVTVRVRCDDGDAACAAERSVSVSGVGTALAVADVDRDGRPEVIASADVAPGDPDLVTVHTIPTSGKVGKPIFKKRFSGGIVGVIADDVDGDGDIEVIAAVRLAGAERVDLWLLD